MGKINEMVEIPDTVKREKREKSLRKGGKKRSGRHGDEPTQAKMAFQTIAAKWTRESREQSPQVATSAQDMSD